MNFNKQNEATNSSSGKEPQKPQPEESQALRQYKELLNRQKMKQLGLNVSQDPSNIFGTGQSGKVQ